MTEDRREVECTFALSIIAARVQIQYIIATINLWLPVQRLHARAVWYIFSKLHRKSSFLFSFCSRVFRIMSIMHVSINNQQCIVGRLSTCLLYCQVCIFSIHLPKLRTPSKYQTKIRIPVLTCSWMVGI